MGTEYDTEALRSTDIINALRVHHGVHRDWPMNAEPWAFLVEFKIGAAFRCDNRIDVLAVRMSYRSQERVAYEVKVSRGDLLRELANPYKRANAEMIAHRWVLATPPGLVRLGELPEGAGLVEVWPRGIRWIEQGVSREPSAPDFFVASLARRASRAEERLRRQALAPDPVADSLAVSGE